MNRYNNISFYTKIFLILVVFLIIFSSIPFSSHVPYFWNDYNFAEYAHNQNLTKKFLEVLPNPQNIHGITVWILEPTLNFLSKLNYNISTKYEYYKYLSIFTILEILILFTFIITLTQNLKIKDILIILFLYLILLVNFSRYDHESYINFPILIFYLFHLLSVNIKNNYLFFFLSFVGNFWAFLINPIYFFVICFLPLIFFYTYYLYNKKFKKFFLVLLANIPFTILFILLSLGTSRFALTELYTGSEKHYNFTILESKNYIFISILFLILSIKNLFEKNSFYSWFFIIFTIISVVLGLIFSNDPKSWKIPPPNQFEYAIQYVLIFVMYKIFKESSKNILFKVCICILIVLFLYRSNFFVKKYIELTSPENDEIVKIGPETNLWFKNPDDSFLKEKLNNKKIFINIPNKYSDFHKSFGDTDLEDINKLDINTFHYQKSLNTSIWDVFFWKNKITTNGGYSHILDINTTLANYFNPSSFEQFDKKNKLKNVIYLTDGNVVKYQTVPKYNYKNPLMDLYDFDYILTDIILDHNIMKNYVMDQTYKFENFNFYLYENIKSDLNKKIYKINIINEYNDYPDKIKKFDKEVFIQKDNLNKLSNTKSFCEIKTIHEDDKIIFNVKKIDSKNCLAIFPITFSHNNLFIPNKDFNIQLNNKCKTFRVQYYFHGCVIKKNEEYVLKKNSLFFYTIGSLRDYIDHKFRNTLQIN